MGRADELRKWVGTTGEDDTEKTVRLNVERDLIERPIFIDK